jgi:hypothetical protein
VVALDDYRALSGGAGDQLDDRARIGTIAYEIAEKGKALGAGIPGVSQEGIQRFEVAVNVGQQSGQHESTPWPARAYPSILARLTTPTAVYAVGLM